MVTCKICINMQRSSHWIKNQLNLQCTIKDKIETIKAYSRALLKLKFNWFRTYKYEINYCIREIFAPVLYLPLHFSKWIQDRAILKQIPNYSVRKSIYHTNVSGRIQYRAKMFARVEMWTKHSAKITLYTINYNFKNLFKEQENKCIKGFQTFLSTLISLFNIMPFIKWESTWHITMPKKNNISFQT